MGHSVRHPESRLSQRESMLAWVESRLPNGDSNHGLRYDAVRTRANSSMPSSKPGRQPLAENLVGMPAYVSRAVTRTPRFALLKILEIEAIADEAVGEKRRNLLDELRSEQMRNIHLSLA